MGVITKVVEHLRGLSGYNRRGEEIPDPTPAALEIPIRPEMSIHERVMQAIQSDQWNQKMRLEGKETFDEANDFDVEDELPEFKSIHEDESGDVIAYEEGLRSGFVEEIPQDRIEASKKALSDHQEAIEEARAKQEANRLKRRKKYEEEK